MNRDRLLLFAFFLFLNSFSATGRAESPPYHVGGEKFVWNDQARGRKLVVRVWYPTALASVEKAVPITPIYEPMHYAPRTPLAPGEQRFPVVLLSHGSGGMGAGLFWIGGFLASQGYLAIAVDHPHNTFGDNSGLGLMRVWDRTVDLTFALDQVIKRKEFAKRIDLTKVVALGHSAGGATALLLAGGRLDSKTFVSPIPRCAVSTEPYYKKLCDEIEKIKPGTLSALEIGRDYRDPRIVAAVAFDPGFVRSFVPNSLKNIPAKLLVITADHLTDASSEIYSKDFSKLVAPTSYFTLPDSVHMTFVPVCRLKPGMDNKEIEVLCDENVKREQKHQEIRERVLKFLQSQL